MNPFAGYRYINVEDIIRANIRPNNIGEDSISLLNALQPITYIATSESQKAINLHRNVIQKLTPKPHTLDLLKGLGYELSKQGDYVYQRTSSNDETTKRENVIKEFQRFYNDLKKIKLGTLDGFEEYIQNVPSEPSTPIEDTDDVYYVPEESRERLSSRASFRPPSPSRMPDHYTVQNNNEKTIETIRSLKEIIKPKHDGHVAHSFIRRKLLFQLFQQKFPDAMEVGDQETEVDIDRRIGDLRRNDRNPTPGSTDEVYYECLLRTQFDQDMALDMLRHNRPNLQPPPEPENPRGPNTTTMGDSLHSIQQQWDALTQYALENGDEQMIQAGDEWKNTVHVVTAIIQLRQQFNNQPVDEHIVNKMFRLVFSELSKIIGQQSELKIEILANVLCEVPADSIQHLNMVDIRDIVLSCDDTRIHDNFRDHAIKFLATDCPICGEYFPRSRMEEMFLCRHTCCLDCVKRYYRGVIKEIKDVQSLKKLTCFEETLDISDDVKMNFFNFLGTKMNQWFTDERSVLDRYHENLYIATRDSKDKKCGNTRCAGFFYNDNTRVARAQCPHCNFQQCQLCCRKWNDEHTKMNCDEYAEWLRENDPDDPDVQLLKYLNTAGMVCPKEGCHAVFEYKAGGCEHFKCSTCNTEFCRICSAFFYNPTHNTVCPRTNCPLKKTMHAHCSLNCYREIRDATHDEIIQLLTTNGINVPEELRQKPQATGPGCPVEDCTRAASVICENRFCEICYKQFLCLFVWRNQIEPWELYTDNNLRQKLTTASVPVPTNAAKPALIALARQHLTQFLGKPKKIDRAALQ